MNRLWKTLDFLRQMDGSFGFPKCIIQKPIRNWQVRTIDKLVHNLHCIIFYWSTFLNQDSFCSSMENYPNYGGHIFMLRRNTLKRIYVFPVGIFRLFPVFVSFFQKANNFRLESRCRLWQRPQWHSVCRRMPLTWFWQKKNYKLQYSRKNMEIDGIFLSTSLVVWLLPIKQLTGLFRIASGNQKMSCFKPLIVNILHVMKVICLLSIYLSASVAKHFI